MPIAIPPGVFDILPGDSKEPWKSSYLWNYVETLMRNQAQLYSFKEIRTPLFERTELFQRGVGETSDIVSKEMYTFDDKGGRSLSLRPEGTAPAMRAFIEHQLAQAAPIHKFFYIAPMFRYERSQAGRYRQHHQFGVWNGRKVAAEINLHHTPGSLIQVLAYGLAGHLRQCRLAWRSRLRHRRQRVDSGHGTGRNQCHLRNCPERVGAHADLRHPDADRL